MAGSARQIVVSLVADSKGFSAGMRDAGNEAEGFGKRVGGAMKVGVAAIAAAGAAAGVAGIAFAKSAVSMASDLSEAQSKSNTVFGKSSKMVNDFAKTAADAYGQSKGEALAFASSMGSVLVASGSSETAAAKLSVKYTQLAADMASFNNTSSADAVEALTGSLTGEFEMMKKYGVVINDVRLADEAQRIGMKKTGNTWTAAQKQLLSYNIIMHDTKQAQGDFGRTSGGLANQQRILTANFNNLKTTIGSALLPVVTKLTSFMVGLTKQAQSGEGWFGRLRVALAAAGVWIQANVIPAVVKLGGFIKTQLIPAVVAIAKQLWENLKPTLQALWGQIQKNILPALKSLWASFQSARPQLTWLITKVLQLAGIFTKNVIPVLIKVAGPILGAVIRVIGLVIRTIGGLITGARAVGKAMNSAFNGVKSAINTVLGILNKVWAVMKKIAAFSPVGIAKKMGGGLLSKLPKFAAGGRPHQGQPSIVGERGPELFIPDSAGRIVPNGRMGGGGGAQNVVLHISGDGDLFELIRKNVRVRGGNVQLALGSGR